MILKKVYFFGMIFILIIIAINIAYLFQPHREHLDFKPGEKICEFKNIIEHDYLPDCIEIKETYSAAGTHLIWKYIDKKSLKEIYTDNDFYTVIAKSYIISILIDSVNLSKRYNMDINDCIFVNIIWYNAEGDNYIDEFLQSIIFRRYNLKIDNVDILKKEIKGEFKKIFSNYFEGKYTKEYFDKLVYTYIGEDKEELSGTDSIKYIQTYEDYYSYYLEINSALHNRNKETFLENCVNLYYYVGQTTERETIQKYKKESIHHIESDLVDIVPNMVEMFGNYSENYYLNGCKLEAKKMEYSSNVFKKINKTNEYVLSKEDINWGENVFITYMKELIFRR